MKKFNEAAYHRARRVSIYVHPDLKIRMHQFGMNWSAIAQEAFIAAINRATTSQDVLVRNLAVLGADHGC